MSTPKQRLYDHIVGEHGSNGRRARITKRWTQHELATWHARQHHRYATSHYHAGPNTDAHNRPPGWYTGADAVPNPTGVTP